MSDEQKTATESTPSEDSQEKCGSCGGVHKSPHSKKLLALFDEFKKCNDADRRIELMESMAMQFSDDLDPADCGLSEKAHHLVDDVRAKHLAFHQSAMTLGRLLVHSMQTEEKLAAFRAEALGVLEGGGILIRPPTGSTPPDGNVN